MNKQAESKKQTNSKQRSAKGFQQNQKKSLDEKNKAARALLILFNIPPKKSLLKSSYPKNYLPNFRTQKNPGIKNFKPKKILRSSPSLEIPSTPPGKSEELSQVFENCEMCLIPKITNHRWELQIKEIIYVNCSY